MLSEHYFRPLSPSVSLIQPQRSSSFSSNMSQFLLSGMFLRRLSKGLAPDHLNLCLNSIEGPTSHHSNSFLLSSQRNLRAVLACVPLLSASVPSQTHLSRSERTFSARRGAVPLCRKSGTGRG